MPTRERAARTIRLPVRLRSDEARALRDRAQECGMTIARYVRETALGAVPRARPRQVEMEAVRELARIGNNLNQLVHLAHLCGELPQEEELREVLEAVLAAARRLG